METFETDHLAHRLYEAAVELLALSCFDQIAADQTAHWLKSRNVGATTHAEQTLLDAIVAFLKDTEKE